MLVTEILLLHVVQQIRMVFIVKAKEHFRIAKIALITHGFRHRIKEGLIEKNFVNFEAHMSQKHDDPWHFLFYGLQSLLFMPFDEHS